MKIVTASKNHTKILIAILAVSIALLIIVRWRSGQKPSEPRKSASINDKMRFYLNRTKSDPTDVQAYIELGKLEEKQEFFTSSLRKLYTARALGATEKEIALPVGRDLSHLYRWDDAIDELTKATVLMPDSVEAVANLAGAYYSSGSSNQASKVLQEFTHRHRAPDNTLPLHIEDLHRLMFCFAEAKDTAGAADIAKEIIRVSPKDAGAYSIAGHSLLIADKFQEALPYFEKAAAIAPDEASLCYNYGIALEHCGRVPEAMKQLQKCVVLNPNAIDAYMELALLYEKQKNWKLSAVALSNLATHSKNNYRVLYRAAKMNERAGNLPEANYWYSSAALSAQQYAEALAYSKKLVQNSDPNWRLSGLLNAADAYKGLHKMKEYVATIKQSASADTAQDCIRLANAYEQADFLDKQLEYLKRALEKEPKLAPVIHYTIAQTLIRRGNRDGAEKELEQAVLGDPKNGDYHTQLGNLYFQRRVISGRLQKAIDQFYQAVRIDSQEASGYQQLGIAYSAANDYAHASFYLEHAIDLQPGYGPSYQELGRVYAGMGDKESSEKMLSLYRKYVVYDLKLKTLAAKADQNKNDSTAQIELADMLASTGDYPTALQRYSMALQLKPGDIAIRKKYNRVLELILQKKTTQTAGN